MTVHGFIARRFLLASAASNRSSAGAPMIPFRPEAPCPLDGIIVLDLSRLVAGNMLSLQLADFGAEVIKVEDPDKGDPLRAWRVEGHSLFWKAYSRNKKSITLDLRKPRAKELLMGLVERANVLVENYRPGTLERMGLAPDTLHARNPRLVIVRVSGWGQTGPYAQKPGFGTLVEGMSGYAAKTGYPDRAPVLPPTALADMVAGLYGAYATMVALREVETRSGQGGGNGQVIDLSLLEPVHSVIGADAAMYKAAGIVPRRQGSRSNITSPRNVYKTRDGRWISISASMQSMAERLYAAVGVPDMIKDPRFADNSARLAHAEEAERPVAEFIARHDCDECLAIFEKAEVTAAPIYDIDQFVADPHVQARQILVDVPDDEIGSVTIHNVIPRLSATPGALRRPAPKLGEHSAEVLARLGIGADELGALRSEGIV
jgi:crotonobetainyl-CoA:carnitine CoA-transferase CaiB-like acyl-CoA transferase